MNERKRKLIAFFIRWGGLLYAFTMFWTLHAMHVIDFTEAFLATTGFKYCFFIVKSSMYLL